MRLHFGPWRVNRIAKKKEQKGKEKKTDGRSQPYDIHSVYDS